MSFVGFLSLPSPPAAMPASTPPTPLRLLLVVEVEVVVDVVLNRSTSQLITKY